MRVLYHLIQADFLERVRRYSFFVTLAFAVYMGLAAARGQISLRLGDYMGTPNSPWVGALMSMTTSVFLSLVGFYIVSTSVHRDQQTRVGSILAATPMSRFAYTLAKAISNFAVLASMVAILAVVGVATIFFHRAAPLELWPLLAPFLFIALPAMAMVAAIAVFFETTPILRTFGSFIYFFFWIFALASSTQAGGFDPIGIHLISNSLTNALHVIDPAFKNTISFGIIVDKPGAAPLKSFLWSGIEWTGAEMFRRLLLFPLAAIIALVPAIWFHRFDPSSGWVKGLKKNSGSKAASLGAANHAVALEQGGEAAIEPSRLTVARVSNSAVAAIAVTFLGELRLLAARRKWWAYAIAAGLIVAGFLIPVADSRHGLVAAIWILPMLVWSRLGAREDLFSTRSLIFTAPHAALRPLLASWLAGACLPLVLSSGILVRLLIAGEVQSAAAIVAGALFAVALALALGNLAHTPKLFEAVYVAWWYVGALQSEPGVDFVGTSTASARPLLYASFAVGLMAVAWGVRELRLRRA
jgi:hypothetical protein